MASSVVPRSLSVPWRHPEAQFLSASGPKRSCIRLPFTPIRCKKIILFEEEEVVEDPSLYPNKYHEPVALVTGASRGIGLEFARQLLIKHPGQVVYATARNPAASEKLQALKRRHPVRCELHTMDVTKEDTIEAVVKHMNEKYGRLDLIVHCAGLLHIPDELFPESYLRQLEPENALRLFEVNALGPIIVTKHFWELLKIGHGTDTGRNGAIVAVMGHKCASMTDNTYGCWYSYRASKTALNMFVKSMAAESERNRDRIYFTIIHPGAVNTRHIQPFAVNVPNSKLFAPDYSVERLLGIVNKVRPEDNSKFTSWDRQEIPW